MDFTREPIIETVITPREGYRLVIRSSKNAAQEEHFVDALEVVSFGHALFFRSIERPKPFIVPVGDYEVLEVREPRMVLKTPTQEKAAAPKPQRQEPEKKEPVAAEQEVEGRPPQAVAQDARGDRRRDRRRQLRRRRGQARDEVPAGSEEKAPQEGVEAPAEGPLSDKELTTVPLLSSILPPPTTLIRDDLARLREQDAYKGAFYIREEGKEEVSDDDDAYLAELRSGDFLSQGEQEVPQEEPFREPSEQEYFENEAVSSDRQVDQKDLESRE